MKRMDIIQNIGRRYVTAKAMLDWNGKITIMIFINHKNGDPVKSYSLICGGQSHIHRIAEVQRKYCTILKVQYDWTKDIFCPGYACYNILRNLKLDIDEKIL